MLPDASVSSLITSTRSFDLSSILFISSMYITQFFNRQFVRPYSSGYFDYYIMNVVQLNRLEPV